MPQSPELIGKIAQWREKQAAGTMTQEDWREAFMVMRESRSGAQAAAAASKARTKGPVDTAALKDSLRSLMRKP